MPEHLFHPVVADWFDRHFDAPSAVQAAAWPAISAGRHTLLSAPTGSGKTLAAFLSAIDDLVRSGLDEGLTDETRVLYVSPLKALSNDIQLNLQQPLMGIGDSLLENGLPPVDIRAWVRTGDTPQSERGRMRRQPPHILATTPESLYILLTSASGREMLRTVRSVIVDEIHALAGNKRGAHLAISLERLQGLTGGPIQRIGISATQEPIEAMAAFLTGGHDGECEIVNLGHVRRLDLSLEIPSSPLTAVMPTEVWAEIYDRLSELAQQHRTTLVFVNTRRLAERIARHLAERLGEDAVTAHHGSLSRESRLSAERRLKNGRLRALVATASLELGIDIGDIDLVCQLGSPRNIAVLLQRVGRSGHALTAIPKGRVFPLSRDDLVECTALLAAARNRHLDRISVPEQPLDVLAQQIVAEVSARELTEDALYELVCLAMPYHKLSRQTFLSVVRMLADGFSTRVGRRGAYLHWDRVNGRLRPRKGARLTAVTNGGAIPDQFDYDVILLPEGLRVGTLNEDFAFESSPGDIFQLGNTSYRIRKLETGRVFVEDARGEPPSIPFWFGEAPGRSDELSDAVSHLREGLETALEAGVQEATGWVVAEYGLTPPAAEQLVAYLGAAHMSLGALPTHRRIVFERFFDEAGDMHLVVHSPYGSRINRAWGLALRKRFCRTFNFELQAAALEDCIILSLGAVHSFPLEDAGRFLKTATVRRVLTQALLDVPIFGTHWRWNATTALAIKRFRNGRKVPPQFQRSDAEDLVSLVFPDQLACLENIQGEREIPDHPLVAQTLRDCLTGVMDIDGLEQLLARIEKGDVEIVARDLPAPSPLAEEIVTARPYAFLDEAPAEERRTLAVRTRGLVSIDEAARIARLDPAAVKQVRQEAWPRVDNPDELHDALQLCGFLTPDECATVAAAGEEPPTSEASSRIEGLFAGLAEQGRASRLRLSSGRSIICAAERLAELKIIDPAVETSPDVTSPPGIDVPAGRDAALREILRSRLECLGPTTAARLAAPLGISEADAGQALVALETEGFVMRGRFDESLSGEQWCERRLLARIHRYTVNTLRREIAPVSPSAFLRFLFHWHGLSGNRAAGVEGAAASLDRLAGFSCAAAAWEEDMLPARVSDYTPDQLDTLTATGRYVWLRLKVSGSGGSPVRTTPITIVPRAELAMWQGRDRRAEIAEGLSAKARHLMSLMEARGARFFSDLVRDSGMIRTEVEMALSELVAAGIAFADSYAGLRALVTPLARRRRGGSRFSSSTDPLDAGGRWDLVPPPATAELPEERREKIARTLLSRYGVVFRKVLERETGLPPWRDLLRTYWRLEARGEVRGGRFVEGFSGEQFAHAEAVEPLRRQRDTAGRESLVVVCGADPANLAGILTPGERISAAPGNRVLFRDGVPVAARTGRDFRNLAPLRTSDEWLYRQLLTKRFDPPGRKRHNQRRSSA